MKIKIFIILLILTVNSSYSKISDNELAIRYLKLGNTYLIQDDLDNSYRFLLKGYQFFKGKNNYWEAVAKEYIGYYYVKNNNLEKAIKYLNEAQLIYQSLISMDKGSQQALENLLDVIQYLKNQKEQNFDPLKFEIPEIKDNDIGENALKGDKILKSSQSKNSIKVINYDNKKLRELPSDIDASIVNLSLANNKFREFPSAILNFKNLEYLNLENNKIKDIPENINQLKSLKYLNLSFNKLKSIPSTITELKDLKILDLKGNKISFEDITNLLRAMPNTNILIDEYILKPENQEDQIENFDEEITE